MNVGASAEKGRIAELETRIKQLEQTIAALTAEKGRKRGRGTLQI
jgi:uncharacterized small protein (DUF1192 family)